MKTIIAGSRTITDMALLIEAINECGWAITEVVSGCAHGPDSLGINYAIDKNLPLHRFPAQWNKYGRSAGYRRNELMAQNAEALIALWDNKSRGTLHMITLAKKHNLKVYIKRVL